MFSVALLPDTLNSGKVKPNSADSFSLVLALVMVLSVYTIWNSLASQAITSVVDMTVESVGNWISFHLGLMSEVRFMRVRVRVRVRVYMLVSAGVDMSVILIL